MCRITEDKIIIYGAGCCGAMFAELLQKSGLGAECFFDRNPAKAGKKIMGIPIQEPVLLDKDSLLIVCILKKGSLHEKIAKSLRQMGYRKIMHIYELRNEKWLFREQRLVLVPDSGTVLKNLPRYNNLARYLSDRLSRQILEKIIQFLIKDIDVDIPALEMREQYFAYDVYQKIPDEYVVDCGAFKGDVMRIFLEKNNDVFAGYLAVEPDSSYLPFLSDTAHRYMDGKIEIKNCALSDKREMLRMRNYVDEDSVVCADGEILVQAFPLDEIMYDRKCTFLKIDVEGYERKTIQGAVNLIRKQKPVIAVAAYHHESDFYELFESLKDLCEDYRFYLRSYMNIQETILYAVPPCRLVKEREDEIYK